MLKYDVYQVRAKFITPVLGAVPYDKEIYAAWILANAEKAGIELTEEQVEQELASIQDLEEKGWTGFHRDEDGNPFEYNYTWKGFMKEACGTLRRVSGTSSAKGSMQAYKKILNGLVKVKPRQIFYILPDELDPLDLEVLERPLRASGPGGERVALARSDILPPGTEMAFQVHVVSGGPVSMTVMKEWFEHGADFIGYRQWRSGGFGIFEVLQLEKE